MEFMEIIRMKVEIIRMKVIIEFIKLFSLLEAQEWDNYCYFNTRISLLEYTP